MSNEMNCANPECGHPQAWHHYNGDTKRYECKDWRGCPCTSYVAPPEPSLDEVIAAVHQFYPDAYAAFIAKGALPLPDGTIYRSREKGWIIRDSLHVARPLTANRRETDEEAWRDLYCKVKAQASRLIAPVEAVEGEAKPQEPTRWPDWSEEKLREMAAAEDGCNVGVGSADAVMEDIFGKPVATPTAFAEDEAAFIAKITDGTVKKLDSVLMQLVRCERQLRAEHFAHAQTKAALAEARSLLAQWQEMYGDLNKIAEGIK